MYVCLGECMAAIATCFVQKYSVFLIENGGLEAPLMRKETPDDFISNKLKLRRTYFTCYIRSDDMTPTE